MLTLKTTKREDFFKFNVIDIQIEELNTLLEYHFNEKEPHMFTVFKDDTPVLLIGLKEMWPMVFDSYTVFSKEWKYMYFRHVLRMAKKYLKYIKYDRIQHLVSEKRDWTHKMANLFEMTCETPNGMKKYVGGQTRYLYVLVGD